MAKQKEAWDKLSMQEKAQLIKLSVDNGVSSLKQIRDAYNLYANGSNLAHKKSGEEEGENQDLNYIQQRDDFKGNFITKLVPRQWGRHGDLSRYYFGQPTQDNALVYSQFKPSKSNNSSAKYIAIALPKFKDYIVDAYFQHPEYFIDDKHYNGNFYSSFVNKNHKLNNYDLNNLGTFTLGKGRDERGDYISYYDIWDTDTSKQSNPDLQKEYLGAAKPFEVYDRIYLDDYYNVPNTEKGTIFLPEITVTPNINKKSTGGPLYPFSFEKNPFLKTPVVRYDEGGEMVNINLPEVTVFPEETYITYTGNESKSFIPTKEEYNEFKANEIRRQALVNMNNRNTPNVPYINNDPAKPGNSCLYTFLSNYPVPLEKSNRVFWELSPEESGFKRVDTALPGDGIQVFSKPQPHRWGSYFWPATHQGVKQKHGYRFPSHMTMFKDINTNGVLIRGSNGSTNPIDTSAIVEERKPISYIHPYNADIYRFVGTKKQQKAWEKEYNNIYKHGNN